jgi:hypothetical protein
MAETAVHWNVDKKHRCPKCHAIIAHVVRYPSSWRVYRCCRCGTRFARWPRLAPLLPVTDCDSDEHDAPSPVSAATGEKEERNG